MNSLRSINKVRLFYVLLVLVIAHTANAQTFNLEHAQFTFAKLDGLSRFHLGDDPDGKLGWAGTAFDDSQWALLRLDRPWSVQGYTGYGGFAWYRFRVLLPSQAQHLAILIPQFNCSYEIFADGKLVGRFGGLPPDARYVIGHDLIFPLPADVLSSSRSVSIAIRAWNLGWLARLGGGFDDAPVIGEIDALQSLKTQNDWSRFWSLTSGNALMLMNLVAAFTGFFLFCMRPGDREYLWFGLYELLTGIQHLTTDWVMFYSTSWKAAWLLDDVLATASWLFFLIFVFRILNGRRNWLFWAAVGTVVVTMAGTAVSFTELISYSQWRIIALISLVPYFVCILSLLYQRTRQGVPDAQLMFAPVAVCYISWFAIFLLGQLYAHGQTWVARDFGWLFELSGWPFPFSFQDVADMLMLLAVLAVLPLRFARSRRDEERLASELESARGVQQVLVPSEQPRIPGFRIESIYKPAGQVGGDFFQILPLANGSTLIAIGDVSGKGMPAALTVALLVGTLRTLAHYTESPAEILSAMNQRMLSRSRGGFTTCLVLRIDNGEKIVVANAGHIAPLVNGKELATENGLPLGLSAGTSHPEIKFHFSSGEQLTLLTDGVLEARGRDGELFGFERTAALSTASADHIAEVAQNFGQEDDITVLTVSRAEASVRA